jgi:hypothetical protein
MIWTNATTASNSNSTFNIIELLANLPGQGIDYNSTITSSTYNPVNITYSIKRCRNCKHGHIEGQLGCIDAIQSSIYPTSCTCKEYVPSDNLEYLEYLSKKKESH